MYAELSAQGRGATLNCWRSWRTNRATTAARRCSGAPRRTPVYHRHAVDRLRRVPADQRRRGAGRPDSVVLRLPPAFESPAQAVSAAGPGDYQDLAPGSPGAVELSAQLERPAPAGGGQPEPRTAGLGGGRRGSLQWRPLMSNYSDSADQPQALTLRPFRAVWWLLEDWPRRAQRA